jgi:hypothetical protein
MTNWFLSQAERERESEAKASNPLKWRWIHQKKSFSPPREDLSFAEWNTPLINVWTIFLSFSPCNSSFFCCCCYRFTQNSGWVHASRSTGIGEVSSGDYSEMCALQPRFFYMYEKYELYCFSGCVLCTTRHETIFPTFKKLYSTIKIIHHPDSNHLYCSPNWEQNKIEKNYIGNDCLRKEMERKTFN